MTDPVAKVTERIAGALSAQAAVAAAAKAAAAEATATPPTESSTEQG